VRYKWNYGCLFAAFTTRVSRETGLTLLQAFKVEMNKVLKKKGGVA
jgi:hypothetical protein